ncbi:LPS export ABC transporter periplasmic protein LptC [Vibrio sp.]|uniref:Lipopolysaccharide export system protein LptC n=1 Tax=Vibrio viridaestus TaxID=2487322 RepID=A0A3N9TBJ2_9VIBR|nr:LPS export ABC transporter periplasmic protein LptC [Vibrio viridaestus]MDC0611298.1 LPS export ABC transporter periplasmic protein LptC [Vibrio sp.]RQW61558.1 LPS export ABC transporter periplasmic protein LptC [Vibrio viridaestus]
MSLSRVIYILLVFVAAWSGYYLLENERKADIQVAPNLELPTFSGDVLSNTTYDTDGVRSYVITSQHLDYYAKSGNTIFEKPILKVYQDGKIVEWKITAEKGILTKNKVLNLYDNVVANNLLSDSSFDSMKTAKLSIDLVSRDFWTETKVTLLGPLFHTIGQALKGNFADQNALLYNHVQGRYENLTP